MLRNVFRTLAWVASLLWCASAFSAAPGVSDSRVVFGSSLGFESVWGTAYRNYMDGLAIYFKQVNANGGVHGRQIEVVRLEDNYMTDKAVANIKRFGEQDEVFGLVCIGGTAITQAALPLLTAYKLPTVGALTGSEAVRAYNRYLFHTRAGYGSEAGKMIAHLSTMGVTRVAVLYQDNAFGKGVLEAAEKHAAARNIQLVAKVAHALNDWKAADPVRKLIAAEPQAVLMFTAPATVAEVMTAYRQATGRAMPSPWVLSVTSPIKLHELLQDEARGIAITQVMPHPGSNASRLSRSYRSLAERGGVQPNMSYEAMEGYVTGRVVVEAMRRAGRNLTRESYVRALEGMGDFNVDDLFVKYSPQSHSGPSFVEVTILGLQGSIVK